MSTIRNNVPTSLITLAVLILTFNSQSRVFAAEQKPESTLWQISSTQAPEISTKSSSFNTTTAIGPTTSSTKLPPSSSKPSDSNIQQHNLPRDDIYIDDEGLEGSGGRSEINDDLEKELEYSGSGLGPDDEDSSSSTTHQRKKGYKSNTGNSGYKPINSKNKEPITDTEINKHPEKPKFPIDTDDEDDNDSDDDLEMGSGHKGINKNGNDEDYKDNDGDDSNTHQIVPTRKEEGDIDIPSGKPDINIHGNHDGDDNEEEEDLITTIDEKINTTDEISIDKSNTGTETEDLNSGEGNEIDLDKTGKSDTPTDKPSSGIEQSHTPTGGEVFIMDNRADDRTASFFAQPGILAAVIGGAVVGLLCAILVVMFIVYRMRKKDEGSYALDEPKRSPAVNSYAKNANNREFYA